MSTRPVSEEPEIVLTNWGIMQDASGFRLVGFHAETRRGRISSTIVAADRTQMIVETESGRIYHLRGPKDNDAAALVIRIHLARWGLTIRDAALADFDEAVFALVPLPSGGWN